MGRKQKQRNKQFEEIKVETEVESNLNHKKETAAQKEQVQPDVGHTLHPGKLVDRVYEDHLWDLLTM